MKVSAEKASEILGVSRQQISRLVAAGELESARFGNVLQIDLDSLHRYQDLRPARGRPPREDSAWAALSDAAPRSLDELKLLSIEVRRRARRRRVRILPGSISRILADPRVVISGAGAAAHHGAAVQDRPPHAIYVRRSDYPKLENEYRLKDGGDANLIMRVAADNVWLFRGGKYAPMAIALLDLVDDRDDRSAAEALRGFA
jgi:excisionase family DNA binding protein